MSVDILSPLEDSDLFVLSQSQSKEDPDYEEEQSSSNSSSCSEKSSFNTQVGLTKFTFINELICIFET